jgi:hypothetical protein
VNSMREVISGTLWIGNALDARDVTGVLGLGILAMRRWNGLFDVSRSDESTNASSA